MSLTILMLLAASAGWSVPECRTGNKSGRVELKRLSEVSEELLRLSGADEPSQRAKTGRKRTVFLLDTDRRLVKGSPATLFYAGMGENPDNFHKIVFSYGMLELVQNEAEAAFIAAHEIAHAAHDHAGRTRDVQAAQVAAWVDARPDWKARLASAQTTELVALYKQLLPLVLADPSVKAVLTEEGKRQERQADADGLALMTLAADPVSGARRFDEDAAYQAMQGARAWIACLGFPPDTEGPGHDSLITRIIDLRMKAAQLKDLDRRVDNASRPPGF